MNVISTPEQQWKDIKRVSDIVRNSQAIIHHVGNRAFYNPLNDSITLPQKGQFPDAARYYAVLLHELGHWTGHSTRLNRPMISRFGTEEYAREELRAEIASLITGSHLKLGHEFGQHAAYVKSWVSILRDEPFELYRAASDAQKITDYILAFEHKRNLQQTSTHQDSFMLRDRINYNNTEYEISGLLPGRRIEVSDLQSGKLIRLSPEDGLYRSLMQTRQIQLGLETQKEAVKNEPIVQSSQTLKR